MTTRIDKTFWINLITHPLLNPAILLMASTVWPSSTDGIVWPSVQRQFFVFAEPSDGIIFGGVCSCSWPDRGQACICRGSGCDAASSDCHCWIITALYRSHRPQKLSKLSCAPSSWWHYLWWNIFQPQCLPTAQISLDVEKLIEEEDSHWKGRGISALPMTPSSTRTQAKRVSLSLYTSYLWHLL